MYRGGGVIGIGGGLAATGAPILMTLLLALAVIVAGLLLLRSGTVRRGR